MIEPLTAAIRVASVHSVVVARSATTVATLEGPVHADAGDAIVTGVIGEQWPVPAATFAQRYQPCEGQTAGQDGLYRRPAQRVSVRKIGSDGASATLPSGAGSLTGKPGDFWVTDDEHSRIVARDVFARTFVWNAANITGRDDPVALYERYQFDLDCSGWPERWRALAAAVLGRAYRVFGLLLRLRLTRWFSMLGAPLVHTHAPHDEGLSAHPPEVARADALAAGQADDPPQVNDPSMIGHAARIETLGARYASLHRGGIVAIHALGAIAVTLAVLPFALDTSANSALVELVGISEVAALVVIILIYAAALAWRRRWLDYRALAEGIRFAGIAVDNAIEPGSPWWQVVISAQVQTGRWAQCSRSQKLTVLRSAAAAQLRYHEQNANSCNELATAGHRLSASLFLVSLAACTAHLFVHASIFLLATAALPACSAAVHGILGALELDAIGASSRSTASDLAIFLDLLERSGREQDADSDAAPEPDTLAHQFLRIVGNELRNWHNTQRRRVPTLP